MKRGVVPGVSIPDSTLCADITDFARDVESTLLFNHSSRVYCFAELTGQRRGLNFDRELLYAAAMFHDLGLTPPHSSPSDRFEVDSAHAARAFLESRGIAPIDVDLVWTAVALHTTPGIPLHMHPVIALLSAGIKMDVVGTAYDEFTSRQRDAVLRAYPRPASFEEDLIKALYEGVKHKPETTFGTVNADVVADYDPHFRRGDFCAAIRSSRWAVGANTTAV